MTMKITSSTPLGYAAPSGGQRRSSGDFSVSRSEGGARAAGLAQTSAAAGMLGLDALMALQGGEDALTGRRRRQIKRSGEMLDALDDLRIGVLTGDIDDAALVRLQSLIADHREEVEDDRLQGILNEIETRAFVELAKRRLM